MHFARLANIVLKDEESARDNQVLANLPRNLLVIFFKSVKIWQNDGHESVAVAPLFGQPCRLDTDGTQSVCQVPCQPPMHVEQRRSGDGVSEWVSVWICIAHNL